MGKDRNRLLITEDTQMVGEATKRKDAQIYMSLENCKLRQEIATHILDWLESQN